MATSALLAARISTRGCFLKSLRPQMLVAGEQKPREQNGYRFLINAHHNVVFVCTGQIVAQSRPLQPHDGQIVIRSSGKII